MRKQNALDWFHDNYCQSCDIPTPHCEDGSLDQITCILATILKKLHGET